MDAFLGRFPPSSVTDLLLFWTSHLKVGFSPFWNTNSVATVDIKWNVFVTIVDWATISILDFLAALAAMALQLITLCIVPMVIFDSQESQKCMMIWFEYSFRVMWWNLIHQNPSNTWLTVQIQIDTGANHLHDLHGILLMDLLVLPVRKRLWDVVHFHLVPHFEECLQRYYWELWVHFWGASWNISYVNCCWFELCHKGQSHDSMRRLFGHKLSS